MKRDLELHIYTREGNYSMRFGFKVVEDRSTVLYQSLYPNEEERKKDITRVRRKYGEHLKGKRVKTVKSL